MSKAVNKTRKKRINCKLTKSSHNDTQQSQQRIKSPHLRILQANNILKGQVLPSKFKFRQKQVQEIQDTVKQLLNKKKCQGKVCRMIMITGSPGAGKTMCSNHVLHKLQQEEYIVIQLNSNIIKKKKDVQDILASQILGLEDEDVKNLTTFKLISELQKSKKKCILYVEEVELFFNSYKEAFSEDFFDIFCNKNLKILLLGISNTIDALEKYGDKLKVKVSEVTNIVFNPYTKDQLGQIITDRLLQVEKVAGIVIKFDQKLIKFVANKINDIKKGDMRKIFEFLKKLANLILPSQKLLTDQVYDDIQVTTQIVNKCFSNMGGLWNKLIVRLPLNQQIILIAIYNFMLHEQQMSITEQQLKRKVKQTFEQLGIDQKKQLKAELSELETYGIISRKPKIEGKNQCLQRYLLKVSLNDIKNCFQDHPLLGKLF